MKNMTFVFTFFLFLGAAGVALAEGTVEEMWKDLDVNENYVISLEEAKKSNMDEKQWELLDANKDGELTFNEFSLINLTEDDQ